MIYRDWRGHGADCNCDSCDGYRLHESHTSVVLLIVGILAMLYWLGRRFL
jgi:hypothetical protein